MEAAGSNPPHRFGRGRIFGQRLSNLLQRQVRSRCVTRHSTPVPINVEETSNSVQGQMQQHNHHSNMAPNPFQPSGSGNTFLAAPTLMQNQQNQHNSQDQMLNNPQGQTQQQDNMLDLNSLFNFDAFPTAQSEFDMAGLSEDRLNELLPSDCWLPVGTDDLMDIAAQFGHQVSFACENSELPFNSLSQSNSTGRPNKTSTSKNNGEAQGVQGRVRLASNAASAHYSSEFGNVVGQMTSMCIIDSLICVRSNNGYYTCR